MSKNKHLSQNSNKAKASRENQVRQTTPYTKRRRFKEIYKQRQVHHTHTRAHDTQTHAKASDNRKLKTSLNFQKIKGKQIQFFFKRQRF